MTDTIIPKVRNMTSPKSGREVCNQFIIEVGDRTYFQSYHTIIGYIEGIFDETEIVFDREMWNCSRTTSKYRNEFLGINTAETRKRIASGSIRLEDLN